MIQMRKLQNLMFFLLYMGFRAISLDTQVQKEWLGSGAGRVVGEGLT